MESKKGEGQKPGLTLQQLLAHKYYGDYGPPTGLDYVQLTPKEIFPIFKNPVDFINYPTLLKIGASIRNWEDWNDQFHYMRKIWESRGKPLINIPRKPYGTGAITKDCLESSFYPYGATTSNFRVRDLDGELQNLMCPDMIRAIQQGSTFPVHVKDCMREPVLNVGLCQVWDIQRRDPEWASHIY